MLVARMSECIKPSFVFALVVALAMSRDQRSYGQEDDLAVRVAIEPEGSVFVGQRIEMHIDVLARDIWANLPGLSGVDIPGAIVVVPPNSSVRLSEQIGGGSFIGQRYELWIFPQRQGKLEIPSQQLNVQLKPFGTGEDPTFKPATTESLALDVTYPDGVAVGSKVICANDVKAQQTWQPQSGDFQVGDGITRTIMRTIGDTPAMILSPFPASETAGVKVYAKQPEVADQFNRGSLTGQRTDRVTYVFNQAGEVQLPKLSFTWWDLDSNKLQTSEFEGMKLQIAPAEEIASEIPVAQRDRVDRDYRRLSLLVGLLIAAIAIVVRYRRSLTEYIQRWQQTIQDSELSYFRRFVATARTNDPNQTLQTLMQWLDVANDRDPAPRLDQFLNQHGDGQAMGQLSRMESAVDSQSKSWDSAQLITSMKHARGRWLVARRHRQTAKQNPLPPLRNSAP